VNVHATTENKSDDMKDSFYEELECVFSQFLKYHIKILLGDLNTEVDREDIFKSTIRNESSHEISNDSELRVANFVTSNWLLQSLSDLGLPERTSRSTDIW
jgi:exonuclease III